MKEFRRHFASFGIVVSVLWLIGLIFRSGDPLGSGSSGLHLGNPQIAFVLLSVFVLLHLAMHPDHFASFCRRLDANGAEPRDRRLLVWILTGLTVTGLSLRLSHIGDFGLVGDEGIFVYTSSLATYGEVLENTLWNSHPPSNFFYLHTMMKVSWNPTWLRMASLLSGTFMIWITYMFGRRLFGTAAGLMMALLVAFSPNLVLLSRVVRNYTPALALMILALYFLVRFIQERRWSFFYLFALFELLTATWLYAFVVVFLGINVTLAAVFVYRRARWSDWFRVGLAQVPLAALLFWAFVEHVPRMFNRDNVLSFMIEEFYITAGQYLAPLINLTGYLLLENNLPMTILFFLLIVAGVCVLLIKGRYWELLLCLASIPFGYLFAVGKKMPFGGTRHAYYLAPFLFALIAALSPEFLDGFRTVRGRLRELTRRLTGTQGTGMPPPIPAGSSSEWGTFFLFALCFLFAYGALGMHAYNEPYVDRLLPEHRLGRVYYRAPFTKLIEAPTLTADLERVWKIVKRDSGPNDLVVLTCPGMLVTRFYHDPGIGMPFDPEEPMHFSREGVNFYYSPEVQFGFTPGNVMRAVVDICNRYRLEDVGKVWVNEVGWELWGRNFFIDRVKRLYPETVLGNSAFKESRGLVFELDGPRARRLGELMIGAPLRPRLR